MREWLARFRDWFRRDQLDRELAEELRFHRERLERDAATDGADAEEARYAARRRLGNVAWALKADYRGSSWEGSFSRYNGFDDQPILSARLYPPRGQRSPARSRREEKSWDAYRGQRRRRR